MDHIEQIFFWEPIVITEKIIIFLSPLPRRPDRHVMVSLKNLDMF